MAKCSHALSCLQTQISYSSVRSFDPSVPLLRPPLIVSLPWNSSHHVFSQLHPGTTYQFIIRASTVKGFGPPTTLNVTTNISGASFYGLVCVLLWTCVSLVPPWAPRAANYQTPLIPLLFGNSPPLPHQMEISYI